MKKTVIFLGAFLCAALSGAEINYKNSFFDVTFDTRGAVIKKLIHKGENWNGSCKSGSSFGDVRIGCAKGAKSQEHENFEKYDFAIKEWNVAGNNTLNVTFTACGTVFKDIRLEKSYKFNHHKPDELIVEYVLRNNGTKPQSLFLSLRTFFRRTGKNNVFYQPRAAGDAALVQSKHLEFVKLPPRRFMAVAADDKSGLLMEFPADSVTGFMNWFLKEGFPTQEYFSDERAIPAGGSRTITVKMTFAKDVHALRAKSSMKTLGIKGKIPPQVEQLAREEDPSFSIKVVKAEPPADRNFVDITFNRQFNDSWRAVKLPESAAVKSVAVYEMENGQPSPDRPVTFALKGKELLLLVPGLYPGNGAWRSKVVDGFYHYISGYHFVRGPITLTCRIFFDRPGGKKVDNAPAGGELYLNGNFEKPSEKNPKVPVYSEYVSNPYRYLVWRKDGGVNNSSCLEGGSGYFAFFPEKGVSYDLSIDLKAVGGGNRCWLYLKFYGADGKEMVKARKLLFHSDNAFEWKNIKKSFIPPEGALMGEVTISRGRKEGKSILFDNFSVKASPLSCVKLSAKEMARQELVKQWDIPIDELEALSTKAVTNFKPWFTPAEKSVDILYLPCEDRVGRLHKAKREVAELAARMPLNIKCIPIIRKVVSSTGSYGVWVMTFRKELSDYTAESLKEIKKAPKVVVLTTFNEKLHSKDFLDILARWQKEGTNFFFFGCQPPKALLGKRIAAPAAPVFPVIRKVDGSSRIKWYQKGNSLVAVSFLNAASNPVIEEKDLVTAQYIKERQGRDFMWWEYNYLFDLQTLRYLGGIRPEVKILSATEKAIEVQSTKNATVLVEMQVRNRYRDIRLKYRNEPVKLAPGVQKIPLPDLFFLPGGMFVAEVRIINGQGQVMDAGAFRIDRAEKAPMEIKFANPEKIFPVGKGVQFAVNVKNPPAGAFLEVEIEDVMGRIIFAQTVKASATNKFAVDLPAPRTLINNVFCRLSVKNGKVKDYISEIMEEFSSPAGKPDLTEYLGLTWGSVNAAMSRMGITAGTLGGVDWPNTPVYIRSQRLLNVDPSPMGMYKYSTTSGLYRGDRKSHPVRTPCFSDPAFHKANLERLETQSRKGAYKYYDVKNFWSGDEQYLGASVCYSPHCLKLFREYLKKEYTSIAELNKEWETAFKSFDEVVPKQQDELKDKNNLAPWLDHKLFMAQVYAKGQFGFFADALGKFTSNVKFGPSGTANPGLGYDWYQMMKYCKLLSYYSGIQVKLIHDFGGKEIRAGKWGGYCHAHIDAEPYIYDPMWEGLIRGANMAAVWPPIMFNGDGTPLRNFFHASRSLKELQSGIGKMWLSAERKPEIALLYSQSSLLTAMNSIGVSHWQNSQSSWVKLLEDLKYDCKFISYEELAQKGVPASYKALILPCSLALSEKEALALEAFVKRGGTLIADVAPGRFDGHGKRKANPVLAKFFPGNRGEIKPWMQNYAPMKESFFTGEKDLGINLVTPYGKGKAVLLNLLVGQYHFITLGGTGGEISKSVSGDAKFQNTLRTLVDRYLSEAKVHRPVRVLDSRNNEFPCMGVMRYDGGNRILALHQTGGEGERFDFKKALPVTVKLAEKGHIYDVREGKYLGFTDTFKSAVLPAWSRIYSIQQEKVTALKVKLPREVKAGEGIEVAFTAAGAKGSQVFHVEIFDPSGREETLCTRNYHTSLGGGHCIYQIPFNGAKGVWRAEVTHVNTGLKAVEKFTVK